MIVENQNIEVTWSCRNKTHFKEKGYIFTKIGDVFCAKAEDLLPNSCGIIDVKCDYCGTIYSQKVSNRNRCSVCKKDACKNCIPLKRRDTNIEKYGEEWYTQTKSFKDKREDTMIDKYGTIHALQNDIIKEKFVKTCIKNNGVEFPMMSDKVKDKRIGTCLERYGVKNSLENKEVRDKIVETCLTKYGVHTTALVPEVREKQRESLYKNGTIASSKPERDTVSLLKEIYGDFACIPQYPTKYYNLDCLLTIGDIKIDVEYDGNWCHNTSFDDRRDKYHIGKGYKILRIKGNHKIPTKAQLEKAISNLVEGENSYEEIILNDM